MHVIICYPSFQMAPDLR